MAEKFLRRYVALTAIEYQKELKKANENLEEANERIDELEKELASLRCKICNYFFHSQGKNEYTCRECSSTMCETCYEYAGEWNNDVNCCQDCYHNKYTECNICENSIKIELSNTCIICDYDTCADCIYNDINMCDGCVQKLHDDHDQSICPNCKKSICMPCINLFKETKCPECSKEFEI